LKKLIKPLKTKAKNNSTNQRQFQQHPDIGCNGWRCREACGIEARQRKNSTAEHREGIAADAEKTLKLNEGKSSQFKGNIVYKSPILKYFARILVYCAASSKRSKVGGQ
jgi:hypothetical protein